MEKVKLDVKGLDANLQAYNSDDITHMYQAVEGVIAAYSAYIDSVDKMKFDTKYAIDLSDGSTFQATCTNVHPETAELIYPLALFEIVKEIDDSVEIVSDDTENEGSTEVDDSLALLFRLKFVSAEGDIITVLSNCRDFAKMLEKLIKIRTKAEKIYDEK